MLTLLPSYLWSLAAPLAMLTFLMVLGGLVGWWTGGGRVSGYLVKLPIIVMVAFCIFPCGDWLIAPLENRFSQQLPPHVSGIIQLGGAEGVAVSAQRGEPQIFAAGGRYIKAVTLARRYPASPVLFSGGGRISHPDYREADVAASIYQSLGIAKDRVVIERESQNTFQNAVFSYQQINPPADSQWLLVTSAAHMPRAVAVFRKAGWNVIPAPADYRTGGQKPELWRKPDPLDQFYKATSAIHEYIGLAVYRIQGRTDELWPE